AAEIVGPGAAGDDVVERVSGAGERSRAGVGQVLDVGAERIAGERRAHLVGAFIGVFRHHVGGDVHDVHVVAGTAGHGVAAGAAVERVVTGAAGERVVAGAAGYDVVQ